MTTAKQCFDENITQHLPSPIGRMTVDQKIAWNLNQGLSLLAAQVEALRREQDAQSRVLEQLLALRR